MATSQDLLLRGFQACQVRARTLNIVRPDPGGHGPFCRLSVEGSVPERPGVYAWVVGNIVMYVGKADVLRQIVHGARMARACNDYTYILASKAHQIHSPRVQVNGLLNKTICSGSEVTWWWLEAASSAAAVSLESELRANWTPPWNRV